ncbi:unnamed protein product [Cuscuta campestris]|uniref:Kinesin motor domain-containing protein n=1 Tax=Cuscuta campestris TaxID=132261 RepID=A0A484MS58_9ASTE|nr:unnamed protein product [Cuscuta campestris]
MSDTISTLRFGKKVKLMKNEPIINEITEDDVNGLSDQIRLLKEELIRARSSTNNGYFKGQSTTRESLNQLRVSLNRSLILPRFDNNDPKEEEEEININEDDIKELQIQIDNIRNSHDEGSVMSEPFVSCSEESESEEEEVPERETDLQDPVFSESPKFGNVQRKSIVVASSKTSAKNNEIDFQEGLRTSGLPQEPEKGNRNLRTSSLRSSRIFPGPTESLAASLQRGLQIIDHHQQNSSESMRPSFSFDHFAVKQESSSSQEEVQDSCLKTWIVPFSQNNNSDKHEFEKDLKDALEREKKLESVCEEQAEKIQKLIQLLSQCKCETQKSGLVEAMDDKNMTQPINSQEKFLEWNGKGEDGNEQEIVKEIQGKVDHSDGGGGGTQCFDAAEREALVKEIETLRTKLQKAQTSDAISINKSINKSIEKLRQSRGIKKNNGEREELESERQRWTEMESDWISLTDELRIDIETIRQRAEKAETELKLEKKCTAELDDALRRSVVGHARMVEHYVDLQEKHNELVEKHRLIMAGIQDIKMAAAKAGGGRKGNRFAKSLAAELSALRVERERERELLRKENRSLKAQLRDTAEAVHAAGELLVRLREAEETASVAEEKITKAEEEKESLKKQMEKQKRKHKMEMATMKGYLAQSRLPEAALLGKNESESIMMMMGHNDSKPHSNYDHDDDDQAWRAEFGTIYQQDY